MVTRAEQCRSLSGRGAPCECFVPGPPRACARVRCCNNPDLPAPAVYEQMLRNPHARCPHPSGDRWAGCAVEPLPQPRLTPQATEVIARVRARLAICRGCAQFAPPLNCTRLPVDQALGTLVTSAEFACPLGRF